MKYVAKAHTSKKYRETSGLIIGFVGILSCFGFAMMIYELITGKYLFAISYLIAVFLGFTYVLIRINTVYATYLALTAQNIEMKNWSNDFMPYKADSKIKVVCEFIPAKTKITEIPVDEITKVMIGTKNFIKRNCAEDAEFLAKIRGFEKSRDKYLKKTISAMDLFYVETREGDCCMPIAKFEKASVAKLIDNLRKRNENIEFRINSRDYRSLRTKQGE